MQTLIFNAEIRTMHPAMPRAEAALVQGDRFIYVGSFAGARRLLASAPHQAIDARGATVLPGFNDAHMHFLHYAKRVHNVLLEGAKTREECVKRFQDGFSRQVGGWLIGEGWNQERFPDRKMLTRADLDAVSKDVPMIAIRACGHIIAVNSAALRRAELNVEDGLLREDEQAPIWKCVPVPGNAALLSMMQSVQQDLFRQGITSIQSDDLGAISANGEGAFLKDLRDTCQAGAIKVRYAQQALMGDLAGFEAFFADNLHALRGPGFHISTMKILADGSLGARTAALKAPYADARDTRGMELFSDEALCAMVREAASHGMPTAIHAIGDAAMEQVLLAFAREGKGLRNAVVHAQITDADQVARCGRMGLLLLAQPIFLDADAPIVQARVGEVLANTSYRWRGMMEMGAHVAFSTDCPVEPFNPFPNLYCAVTRKGLRGGAAYLPEEAFTLDEALYAYTAAGAYASGEEEEKGRVWPGMLADFILLKDRLCEKEPTSLLEAGVRGCFVGGEAVYRE